MYPHPVASRTRLTPIATAARLLFAGALAASAAAFAQAPEKKPETLKEIDVIATAETGYVAKASATATKTDTLLRDTPQAITVITKELMRDQNMQNMADVLRYVPGIMTAQGEGNRDAAVFRGNSSTSDFYVDGMRDDVQYFRDFYNIDSVEALKGSNAMIFGRGGSGGVINRVTKTPQWTPVREASLTVGSWKNRRATADVGHAVSDTVALRVNAMVEDSESYRNGVTIERKGINPTLALRAGPDTNLVLGYEYFADDRTADRGVPSQSGRPYATDPSAFFGNADLSNASVRMHAFTSVLEHDFGNGLTLRNRTRLADYDKFYQNVYPNGPVAAGGSRVLLGAYNDTTARTNLFIQTDLFYTLNTGGLKHKLAAGVELGHQENDSLRQTSRLLASALTVPLANPVLSVPLVFSRGADSHTDATVSSVYLQDQIEFSPKWQAILGLRYDRFSVKHTNKAAASQIKVSDSPLSPRVGLVYKPVEALSLYGSYSIAYVPRSGEQLNSLTATNKALEPEEFKNAELGAKWDITPSLQATAAVYKLERTNMLVPSAVQAGVSFLADGQTSKGVELGLSGRLTKAWSVMGGYAYQDAKLASNTNSPALNGNTLPLVPSHSLSLWNKVDFNSQLGAGLGLVYRDSIYAGADNAVTVPSYTRVDAALYYTLNKNYQLQLNVENLADRTYYASAHNNNNITPGAPRTLRLTVNASF